MSKKINRDIVIPARKIQLIESLHQKKPIEVSAKQGRSFRIRTPVFGWILLVLVVGVSIFYGVSFFAYATVQVVPRGEKIVLDDIFFAEKEVTGNALPLKTMTLHAEVAASVPASEKKQVSEKASGEIIIYNMEAKPQPLVARTRFETPEGKVYRSEVDVVVPAATVAQGKKVPGSVTTRVVASLPGVEYNQGLKDFILPGLKGTPKATTVYARSKTPLAGGFLGERLVAGAADLKTAEVKLVATLEQKLRLAATTQVPQGYLVYPEGSWLTIVDSSKDIPREGIAIEIARKGTLEAILMKSTDLAKRIAQKKIAGYKGEAIQVDGLSLLTFTMKDKPTAGPSTLDKLQFQLKGTVQVVYTAYPRRSTPASSGNTQPLIRRESVFRQVGCALFPRNRSVFGWKLASLSTKGPA